MDLLTAQVGALVLKDLFLEGWCKVVDVAVSAGAGHHHVVAFPADEIHHHLFGLGCGRANQLGALAKPDAELDHVPGFLKVLPCGQLIQPATMELRPPEALGLRRRYALDEATIDKL